MVIFSVDPHRRHHHHHYHRHGFGLQFFTYTAIGTLVGCTQEFNTFSNFAIFPFVDATLSCLLLNKPHLFSLTQ
jgi:hypothetical protein